NKVPQHDADDQSILLILSDYPYPVTHKNDRHIVDIHGFAEKINIPAEARSGSWHAYISLKEDNSKCDHLGPLWDLNSIEVNCEKYPRVLCDLRRRPTCKRDAGVDSDFIFDDIRRACEEFRQHRVKLVYDPVNPAP
ncbi:hypothetical protein WA026_006446, partial [Henosepilachna vigintioctopunctata]